jgi:tetraacyldisaccharide 4'-kinase
MMRTNTESKSWFYILLTSYGELYSDDFMLPTGNLRESRSGAKGLYYCVTKCPLTFQRQSGTVLKQVGNCGKSKAVFYKY